MKVFNNLLSLLCVIVILVIAFFTMTGDTQTYIHFESVESEIGFIIMLLFIAAVLVMSVVVPDKKQ